jgi:hypothetical protein
MPLKVFENMLTRYRYRKRLVVEELRDQLINDRPGRQTGQNFHALNRFELVEKEAGAVYRVRRARLGVTIV